jgi:hypothetical protein
MKRGITGVEAAKGYDRDLDRTPVALKWRFKKFPADGRGRGKSTPWAMLGELGDQVTTPEI